MINKELFKQNVYKKYEENINNYEDDFYNTHYYKSTKFTNIKYKMPKVATVAISCITTASMVYAGVVVYNFYQSKTKTDFEKNINYDYMQDMTYQEGIYYKKVLNLEEYKKCQKRWNGLIEITQEEFESNFIMIIAVENTSLVGLSVSDVKAIDDTLNIEFYQNFEDIENNVISLKIPISENRDKIKFRKISKQPESNNYINIKELPKEYSKENAIKDSCIVIEEGKVISNNKEKINEFIENSQNGADSFIRIVNIIENKLNIIDIEFKDKNYYVCKDTSRTNKNSEYTYLCGNEIVLSTRKGTTEENIYLKDKFGNQYPICNIY